MYLQNESKEISMEDEVMDMLGFPVKPQSAGNALREQFPPPPPSGTGPGSANPNSTGPNNKSRRSVRSTALRHISSVGDEIDDSTIVRSSSAGTNFKKPLTASRNDLREAWREYEMQTVTLTKLEEQLRSVCTTLSLSADDILEDIDNILAAQFFN